MAQREVCPDAARLGSRGYEVPFGEAMDCVGILMSDSKMPFNSVFVFTQCWLSEPQVCQHTEETS